MASFKLPKGSSLAHGAAHQADHRRRSRRDFLRKLGIATGGTAMLGGVPVTGLGLSPLQALSAGIGERVLVVVRLSGGNDGLNTVIPTNQYNQYANLRPTLAIPANQSWQLSDEYAMPNFMSDAQSFWNEDSMRIVHNVGYDVQNLSHFRSTDIWESASDADVQDASGWLGRLVSAQHPNIFVDPPEVPAAVQIGGSGSLVFNNADQVNLAFSVVDPTQLEEIAANGAVYDPLAVNDCYSGAQLSFLRSITNANYKYAAVIPEYYNASNTQANYTGYLGQQLRVVARLIKGDLGTKLYMVDIGGFDTHADQAGAHDNLMEQVTSQLRTFFDDLSYTGHAPDVLAVTVSEFGRRIEENGSAGTDHGAASNVLLFGQGLNGSGFVGQGPDLGDVDEVGNLRSYIDFRQVYATLLEQWLCLDPTLVDDVLGQSFERLDLGLSCQAVSTNQPDFPAIAAHIRYGGPGEYQLHYALPAAGELTITFFSPLGQELETVFRGRQSAGEQQLTYRTNGRLPSGMYIVRFAYNGRAVSKRLLVAR